jgi:hypothetical protein
VRSALDGLKRHFTPTSRGNSIVSLDEGHPLLANWQSDGPLSS